MAVEWANQAPDLLMSLDRARPDPLRMQLETFLRDAIRSGRLQEGERLPPSRELARQLGVSRGVVQDCYVQLQAEGYLTARVGSATRVAACVGETPVQPPLPTAARLDIDFRPGVPDLASFPREDWLWATREALRDCSNSAFDYGDPRGNPDLRTVLAAYLRRVRAAAGDTERVVICTGFAQGLSLALRALTHTGVRRIGFETPGYDRADIAAAQTWAGIEPVRVPVDDDGIDVTALTASGVRAVVLTPAHQSPTGVALAPDRRQQLIAWARSHDATIVEDDYDAEFRYDREPVGVLQGLAPDRVVLLGTTSKSLAPAMRLGWLLCPAALIGTVCADKQAHDRGSPLIDQLALARLIEAGRYDRHLRRMRAAYARRRRALVEALSRHAPTVRLTGLAAGFHAVAHLPGDADENAIIAAARARKVGLHGMSQHRADEATTPPQLVLGFGNLTERAIAAGIATIADLLK